MTTALWLMALQGIIGAFDTLYYHEWRARLPAMGKRAAKELELHAGRDFLYAILFTTLPWIQWHGLWAGALCLVLVAEIALTLWDFITEIAVRKPLGDVYAGERVTHAIMGILYGGMLAFLVPTIFEWWSAETAFEISSTNTREPLCWALSLMGAGVFLSGLRDLYAAFELPGGNWPWNAPARSD